MTWEDRLPKALHLGRHLASLCCIGEAVASLAKPMLIDIEKTTHRMEKKREWERSQEEIEET